MHIIKAVNIDFTVYCIYTSCVV